MPYVAVASEETGPVTVEPSSDRDGVSLTDAFRLAKILAGWEVRVQGFVPGVGATWFPVHGEPVNRWSRS